MTKYNPLVGVEVSGFVLEESSWFEQFGFDMDIQYEETDRQALAQKGVELLGYGRNTRLEYSKDMDVDYAIGIIGRDWAAGELNVYFWERGELVLYRMSDFS